MYEALLDRSLQAIDDVKRHVDSSSAIRALIAQKKLLCATAAAPCFDLSTFYNKTPNVTAWKVIDHCAAVTRLYAIYEQFVHEILREFLSFLESNFQYGELSPFLRDEHRRTLGQILINLDREKYSSLNFESIVDGLKSAFNTPSKYHLLPEAMLLHEQNLRLSELDKLFHRCGIENVSGWLLKHSAIKGFFKLQARQSDKVEAELKLLVGYRNEAAHGGIEVDAVLGADLLLEYADFLAAVFVALAECIEHSVIGKAMQLDKVRVVGKISEKFSRNICVAIVENATLSVEDVVYLRGDNYCHSAKISSIQQDGAPIQSVTTLKPIELGIQFNVEPRMGAEIVPALNSSGDDVLSNDGEKLVGLESKRTDHGVVEAVK